MKKEIITKMRENEFNFLKNELERIEKLIKALGYEKWTDQLNKLWELRGKIKENLDKFIKEYPALFK